jgi:hypothetical protein
MLSYLHELLLLLFRKRSTAAAELLRELHVQLPAYDKVRVESSNLSSVRPAEYDADLVLLLLQGGDKMLGIIVEVQLGFDEDKLYSWPAYVANLRARHRCPACLLVVTPKEAVARWARKPIDLGPGGRWTPCVIGPSNTPAITELHDAEANVELSVLSAVAHGKSQDVMLATRIASAAVMASAALDAERAKLYSDLVFVSLSHNARRELLEMLNSLGFEYQSDFARHYVAEGMEKGKAEGKAEGRAEGRVEIVLKLLTLRFGPISDAVQSRVRAAGDGQIDSLAERVLTARSLTEALNALS